MGRIGFKVSAGNPKVVYVIAECNDGTLFRSNDADATFEKLSSDRSRLREKTRVLHTFRSISTCSTTFEL